LLSQACPKQVLSTLANFSDRTRVLAASSSGIARTLDIDTLGARRGGQVVWRSAIWAKGDIQQLKVLAASSNGIAPVSAYGVAARPIQADRTLFICFTNSNSLTKPTRKKFTPRKVAIQPNLLTRPSGFSSNDSTGSLIFKQRKNSKILNWCTIGIKRK
jgi:hypothetical protein